MNGHAHLQVSYILLSKALGEIRHTHTPYYTLHAYAPHALGTGGLWGLVPSIGILQVSGVHRSKVKKFSFLQFP